MGNKPHILPGMSKEEFAARFKEVTGKKLNLDGDVSPDLLRDLEAAFSLPDEDDLPHDQVQAHEDLAKLVEKLEGEGKI